MCMNNRVHPIFQPIIDAIAPKTCARCNGSGIEPRFFDGIDVTEALDFYEPCSRCRWPATETQGPVPPWMRP
jgi:hypothetical protein